MKEQNEQLETTVKEQLEMKLKKQSEQLEIKVKEQLEMKLKEHSEQLETKLKEQSEQFSKVSFSIFKEADDVLHVLVAIIMNRCTVN